VLLCTRCRREQNFCAETSAPEGWMERGNRSARAHDLMDARIQRRR
jgi:hypothetical protein